MTPRKRACTPPMKQTMHAVEAQPATLWPVKAVISAQMMPRKDSSEMISPARVMKRMGLTERLVTPSKARA